MGQYASLSVIMLALFCRTVGQVKGEIQNPIFLRWKSSPFPVTGIVSLSQIT